MRIAVWHNMPSGGGKRALSYHARGLVERGHTLECWCPPTANRDFFPLSDVMKEHVVALHRPEKRARHILDRITTTYRMTTGKLKAIDKHCSICAQQINNNKCDVLFANSSWYYAVESIGRYSSIPAVLYLQEPYRLLYEARPLLPWIAPVVSNSFWRSLRQISSWLYDFLAVQWLRILAREELLNAYAFDMILVNSYFSRESLLRAYGIDSQVCYLGVDTEKFSNTGLIRQDFILGVGAISPRKNIDFIIKALGYLPQPRPPLVWVGDVSDPEYLGELFNLARTLEVDFQPRVNVDDEELIKLMNTARLMAYAPRLEPFGLAPLEANACGLPVVSVAEGGVRETVVDGLNGYLVPHAPEAMAQAISALLNDSCLAANLGENARKWVNERWSLDAAIDRIESYLNQAVEVGRKNIDLTINKDAYWEIWK